MNEIDKKSIAAIRNLVVDSVENAKHGHMGAPLGAAPMGYELFRYHLKHNPKNPNWFNRDRFVLTSAMARYCCILYYIYQVMIYLWKI